MSAKLRRGDLLTTACPSREVLKRVTSRWGVLVLIALETETLRFSQLRRKIGGVSERMLAQTLQCLDSDDSSGVWLTILCRRTSNTA